MSPRTATAYPRSGRPGAQLLIAAVVAGTTGLALWFAVLRPRASAAPPETPPAAAGAAGLSVKDCAALSSPEWAPRLHLIAQLDLRDCGLRALPSAIGQCVGLKKLDLGGNPLADLPDALANCAELEILFLLGSKALTSVPRVLGRLPKLTRLGLKSNAIRQIAADALPPSVEHLILTDNELVELPPPGGGAAAATLILLHGFGDSGGGAISTLGAPLVETPGLRTLQSSGALDDLLAAVAAVGAKAPVFLKIAPDIADSEAEVMVEAIRRHGLDGIIIANTTITRPESLVSDKMGEGGGLSGPPVFARSTELVRVFRKAAGPDMAIIGVGGVSCAETAYAKIRAGANAIQLYTGLIYEGPGLIQRIKTGLVERLQADGFASISEAVGAE